MPGPDVRYVLDGSLEAGHIAGDTHFYLMEIAQNSNEIVDASDNIPYDNGEDYWLGLSLMGHQFENAYLSWRATNPQDARLASFKGLQSVAYILKEHGHAAASYMASQGIKSLNANAITALDKRHGFSNALGVAKRALVRGAHDFRGWSRDDLHKVCLASEFRHRENYLARQELISRLSASITQGTFYEDDGVFDGIHRYSSEQDMKKTEKVLREKKKQNKKIIKRSIKLFQKLAGGETTRMFIGGHSIRFEGNLAIYEIRKASNLLQSHGGFRALSVFDKDLPELHLCDVCLYTPDVPLLDHAASIVMHIQSGMEEEILRIGNAKNISKAASEREWLVPYLPQERSFEEIGAIMENAILGEGWVSKDEAAPFLPIVNRYIFDKVIKDHIELYRNIRLITESRLFEPLPSLTDRTELFIC